MCGWDVASAPQPVPKPGDRQPSAASPHREAGRVAGHWPLPTLPASFKYETPLAGLQDPLKDQVKAFPELSQLPMEAGGQAGQVSVPRWLLLWAMTVPNWPSDLSPKSVPSSRQRVAPCPSLGPAVEPPGPPTSTAPFCDSRGTCWPAGPDRSSTSWKLHLCAHRGSCAWHGPRLNRAC